MLDAVRRERGRDVAEGAVPTHDDQEIEAAVSTGKHAPPIVGPRSAAKFGHDLRVVAQFGEGEVYVPALDE